MSTKQDIKQDAVNKFLRSTEQTKQLQRAASDSIREVSRDVNKRYQLIVHITDVHDNAKFFDMLVWANMVGALVIITGDMTNNQILSPHADPYADIRNPEDQIRFLDMQLQEAERRGIDLSNIVFIYVDGNHEYRLTRETSLRSTRWLLDKHNLGEAYAANIAFGQINMKTGDKKLDTTFTVVAEHGDNDSANSGKNASQNLQKPRYRNVDGRFTGHNHKGVTFANQTNELINDKGEVTLHTTYTHNGGSMQEDSEYADRAGYGPSPMPNGELLLASVSLNKTTNEPEKHLELINVRDVLTPEIVKLYNSLNIKCKRIEKDSTITTEEQMCAAYDSIRGEAARSLAKIYKTRKIPTNEFYTTVFSAALVGQRGIESEEITKKLVNGISKKKNAFIPITGNMFDVPTQLTMQAQQVPEIIDKLFSDMYISAKRLKPAANTIIGYQYNLQEIRLASPNYDKLLHAIVKKAMKTFQMDESLAYKPVEDQPTEKIEQFIFTEQSKKVYEANSKKLKEVLVPKYLRDAKFLEVFAEHMKKKFKKVGYNTATKEKEFKLCLSDYINKNRDKIPQEDWLLQMDLDKDEINKKFPIDTTGLMLLHENAVSNVYFTMMGLKPEQIKKIKITQVINDSVVYLIPVPMPNGKTRIVKLLVQSTNCTAGRGAIENKATKNEAKSVACDIYMVTSQTNAEYLTKTKLSYIDEHGKPRTKTAYHISPATLTGRNKYSHNEVSEPRIYKCVVVDGGDIYMESLDTQSGVTDFFDIQVDCINRLISQSMTRTENAMNERNAIHTQNDENLLIRLTTKKINEAKEAEKARLAQKQQKVVTVPVETVAEEINEEVLEDDALKVG